MNFLYSIIFSFNHIFPVTNALIYMHIYRRFVMWSHTELYKLYVHYNETIMKHWESELKRNFPIHIACNLAPSRPIMETDIFFCLTEFPMKIGRADAKCWVVCVNAFPNGIERKLLLGLLLELIISCALGKSSPHMPQTWSVAAFRLQVKTINFPNYKLQKKKSGVFFCLF